MHAALRRRAPSAGSTLQRRWPSASTAANAVAFSTGTLLQRRLCTSGPSVSGPEISGPEISGPEISGPEISGPERAVGRQASGLPPSLAQKPSPSGDGSSLKDVLGDGTGGLRPFQRRNSLAGWVGQNVITGMGSPTCDLQHRHQQAFYFCSPSFLLQRWRKTLPRRLQQPPTRPHRHCKWLATRCVLRAPATCRSSVLASSAAMGLFANACAIIGPSYRAT